MEKKMVANGIVVWTVNMFSEVQDEKKLKKNNRYFTHTQFENKLSWSSPETKVAQFVLFKEN